MKIQYKFKRNVDIGSLDAENDKFLISAFVDKNDLSILQNINDPKSIILGRTGTGKSALINYLETKEKNVVRIEPESMSLRHLSNSNIINYFKDLDVKLDLFYKVLWKHVFIVELIKVHFDNNISKSKSVLEWLKSQFSDKSKKHSIEYLETWGDRFWENTEYRIRELETSLESRFLGSLGGNIQLKDLIELSSKVEAEQKDTKRIKYEVITKAQKVINETQLEHIKNIIDLMKEKIFNKTQKKYFIVIDDLDKEWVSNAIVYDLIKALIETIKEFSKIPNVKIIIALRTNIHKKIFKINIARGIQREKYNHLYLDIRWEKEELKRLINYRLRELMKGTYTNDSPTIDDILPDSSKKSISGFDFIIENSFLRPRDIIDFFNKCIKYADGKTKITRDILKAAYEEYSHERLRALNDEWLENYGNLHCLYGFLKGQSNGFTCSGIEDVASEYFLQMIVDDEVITLTTEYQKKFSEFGNTFECNKLLMPVLVTLYEIGLLGIKLSPDKKLEYIYESYTAIEQVDIKMETKFYIHPMFKKALRVIN
ncbi:MAG: hypothetical protein K8R63_02390 [Bacteroidales bacterium]|nr:hypothetical protein [Bacteroidales bacterium]